MNNNMKLSLDVGEHYINYAFNDGEKNQNVTMDMHIVIIAKIFRSIDALEKLVKLVNASSGVL